MNTPPPGRASEIVETVGASLAGLHIRDAKIVVAISGGADSSALLLLLSALRTEAGLDLVAAHFDHQLRDPSEIAADKAFVERLCVRFAMPAVFGAGDVRQHANDHGQSIEEAARNLRYEFLRFVALAEDAGFVAVGHTADDQVETVLHRLIRGTGIEGLAGMRPRRAWPFGEGPTLIRPLLTITRDDTETYCRDHDVEPREDSTNHELAATRNRIRHQLLPVLREMNPTVGGSILRLSEIASDQLVHLDRAVAEIWPTVLKSQAQGDVVLDRIALVSSDRAVAVRCIQRAVYSLRGADLGSVHIEQILGHLSLNSNWRIDLPGRIALRIDGADVIVSARRPGAPATFPESNLDVPGETTAGAWTIEATSTASRPPSSDRLEALVAVAAIQGKLLVRPRQPGDSLRPLGLNGEKKVQDILVDAKVPREQRDGVPIVCDEAGIIWIPGHCIAERVRLTEKTTRVIQLRARATNDQPPISVDGASV